MNLINIHKFYSMVRLYIAVTVTYLTDLSTVIIQEICVLICTNKSLMYKWADVHLQFVCGFAKIQPNLVQSTGLLYYW